MSREKTLLRLARLRQVEEELSRLSLERAVAERSRILRAWESAAGERAEGRREFARGVEEMQPVARHGGLVEAEQSRLRQKALEPALAGADREVERLRIDFLSRRTATRQAEILLEQQRVQRAADENRRVQQMLDDWYGRRLNAPAGSDAGPSPTTASSQQAEGKEQADRVAIPTTLPD